MSEIEYVTIDRAELKQLQKDAERYRFMRDSEELGSSLFSSINEWLWACGDFQDVAEDLDAAISAAGVKTK